MIFLDLLVRDYIMRIILFSSFIALSLGQVAYAEDAKPEVKMQAVVPKVEAVKPDVDKVNKIKEEMRSKVTQKIDKYKMKLDNYLKARGQDDASEGIPGEYEKLVGDIKKRISQLETYKQKLLGKINQKYDFTKDEAVKKVDGKLKVIKKNAFEGLPYNQIK
jgi:DNA repair exonuclease SbcCD ATPase subunit